MKRLISGKSLLVFLEVVLLIAVIILSIVHAGKNALVSTESTEDLSESNTEINNDIEESQTGDDSEVVEQAEPTVDMPETVFSQTVTDRLAQMSTEEKVAQLFFITPEALTGMDAVNVAGNSTKAAYDTYPVGGLIYSEVNFQGQLQTSQLMNGMQSIAQEKMGFEVFLAVEELGGDYSPLASSNHYEITGSPQELAAERDEEMVHEAAVDISEYLNAEGFNAVLAPNMDLSGEGYSYGEDTEVAEVMIKSAVSTYREAGIHTVATSYQEGTVYDGNTYRAAIEAGADILMVAAGQFGDGNAIADTRSSLGYTGVIITGDLSDAQITGRYSAGEAAVAAVNAGADMLYNPADFEEAYDAVLEAVGNGSISTQRLDEAAGRVLSVKLSE